MDYLWREPISYSAISMANSTCCVSSARGAGASRYSVRKLIEKYGLRANMMKWKQQLNGDCPKRDAPRLQERRDLLCPDLPKVI
jgi:hypothetical protein